MRTLNECLSEMESAIRRVEDCIAEARAMMAEMERLSPDADLAPEPLDINLEDMVELDEAFGDGEMSSGIETEPVAVSVQESNDTLAPEPEPSEDLPLEVEAEISENLGTAEDLPLSFSQEPEPVRDLLYNDEEDRPLILDSPVGGRKSSVMDVVGKKNSWRTDMPGTPVKNILSAISLNDRILFINTLFRRDALLFQSTVSRVNNMADFEEAESYLTSMFPEWKLDSEAVYRLMMAIRRRFN